jgi:hypothetical protein
VTPDVDIQAQKALLSGMAEMAGDMAKDCHARFKAAGSDNEAKDKAIAAFDICGRNVRLSILAEVRLFTAVSTAVFNAVANDQRGRRVRSQAARERDRDRDRYLDRERESDRDRERDGFPMTAMGRAEALEKTIAKNPDLDPEGRYSATIIDIKARLNGEIPPPPEPDPAPTLPYAPANRAERRRLERRQRRASG